MIFWWSALALAAAPSLVEPTRTGMSSPDDAAVLIGIERYAFLPDVPHASRDLDAMADLMIYTRGVPPERVRRLNGANREQILSAVDAASNEVGPNGTLWVYFAGHGAADPVTANLILVGDDAKPDPQVFTKRSIPVEDLTAALPDGSMLILDTCWAGAARGEAPLLPDARFTVPTWAMDDPKGVTVWTASGPSEIAGAYHPARHGAFTYFVVGALRGWADGELTGEPDGEVDLREAHAWVGRALAATGTRSQQPTLIGSKPGPLTQGRLDAPLALSSLPENTRRDAVVIGAGPQGLASLTLAPAPRLAAVQEFLDEGYAPPIRYLERWQFEDSRGRTVPYGLIYPLVPGTSEGDALQRKLSQIDGRRLTGLTLISVGITGVALSPAFFSRYLKSANKSLGCHQPDAISYVCINEGRALGTGTALFSAGAVSFVSGWLIERKHRKKALQLMPEVTEQANKRLE